MDKATLVNDPEVLPESLVQTLDLRTCGSFLKLFTSPQLMAEAVSLYEEHGPAVIAFLMSTVRLEELKPGKLSEAFKAENAACYRTWSRCREALITQLLDAVLECDEEDAKFLAAVEADPQKLFRAFSKAITVARIADKIHVFITARRK